MKTLIILAHPDFEKSIVNKAYLTALKEKSSDITVNDLYKLYPDWKFNVKAEQQLLLDHDRIIFQFPVYWFNMTTLLKKWLDDILLFGWAYGPSGDKMKGKEIGISATAGAPLEVYQPFDLPKALSSFEIMTNFMGAEFLSFHCFYATMAPDAKERLEESIIEYINFVLQ